MVDGRSQNNFFMTLIYLTLKLLNHVLDDVPLKTIQTNPRITYCAQKAQYFMRVEPRLFRNKKKEYFEIISTYSLEINVWGVGNCI